MKTLKLSLTGLIGIMLLAACVTINVYFPAAAAEKAADRIIDEVYGAEKDNSTSETEQGSTETEDEEPQAQAPLIPYMIGSLLEFMVGPAQAQSANFNVSTPAIETLKARMAARHSQLLAHYRSGAIGLTNQGEIILRDPAAVPLRARNQVNKLVKDENQDRSSLYLEIAKANGQPGWEKNIRETFARRWIGKAEKGWWYQNSKGQWGQK